ncbi:Sec-independent protein translocase subunit TatA [Streptomyces sp. RB6PN25]|uniref:Sec-independent protein translocase protein TatA n=1 Tax=Streptomyces humicola TaxID=2953240 RepID=A0ABT1PTN0_9ACTN|nr:Sec-independent protein translocase subunit TatA [Streptomyces humicola]MCQ4081031.1 Sec-independent protein translocase subunit TatA [Streptomyces humicola]
MFRNGLEPWHVILVVVVCLLLFGSKKLPDAARGLGKSLRILKAETRALREDGNEGTDEASDSAPPARETGPREALEPADREPEPAAAPGERRQA